jgi:hypothetical protein
LHRVDAFAFLPCCSSFDPGSKPATKSLVVHRCHPDGSRLFPHVVRF